ncbi:MAG: hypothetical protein ACREMZ_06310 [Gemmatimonadales bacterium]
MKRALAVLATFAVAGCAPSRAGPAEPRAPQPDPGPPAPGVPAPTGVIYRPVSNAAYTLERHDTLNLQLPGGASQLQLIDRTAHVRVTITPDTAGYLATIVLDSLDASAGGVPAAPDSLLPAWGTRWTASLSPEGELSALIADRTSTLGDQVGGNLRSLFPSLPAGGVRPGMEWTDTTEVPLRADAFDATERALTSYRASESDDPRIGNAIRLESNASYERTGKGTQFDQQLEMTAAGGRTAVHYLGEDGTLIAAQGSDSGGMTITVPEVGQTVPVKQSGTYSITSAGRPDPWTRSRDSED